MQDRLESFEQMLAAVQTNHENTSQTMEQLRQSGREKSATFRQLLGDKMLYQSILNLYKVYGLLDNE